MKNYIFLLLIATFFVGCNSGTTTDSTSNEREIAPSKEDKGTLKAVANIMAKSNSNVAGTVTFTQTGDLVTMVADISGLTPGNHAIHIHANGDCSAADGSSAGGHWNPTNVNHGKWGTAPFHLGDIGNIMADSNGVGTYSRETDLWCIHCADANKDITGKSIIIHAGVDDFSSQPAGAAGARIGCGEIVLQ
ncbi:MAG: superoxide dismutase family protein [Bacteroidetes bacterium]|nr:superoxide dismutase family protein [Bacteroidota bacterium]